MESENRTRRWNVAAWLGPPLAFVGAVSYFLFFVRFPSLRDSGWLNLLIVLGALALSALGLWRARGRGWVRGGGAALGLLLSAGIAGLFSWYVLDYSYEVPDPPPSRVGEVLADFTLQDHRGEAVTLSSLRGRKILLVFYRGHW